MAGGTYTTLKGVSDIGELLVSEQLAENLRGFFDWGLLQVGGFKNITQQTLSNPSGDRKIYETGYNNLIWETNIPYSVQPSLPQVYVNNVLTTTGFYINYRNGQVVFSSANVVGTTVKMSYSYRLYNFYSSDTDWFQTLIFSPLEDDDANVILSQNRIHLPAIIIEPVASRNLIPYEIGDGVVWADQPVLMHILSNNSYYRDKMIDIFTAQYNKTIFMYDSNLVAASDDFPLNYDGSLKINPKTYPELVDQYRWKFIQVYNVRSDEISKRLPFFRASVRLTLRFLFP